MSEKKRKNERDADLVSETVKTTIALARDLWQQVKIEAIKRGLTFTQVVEAALRKWLELEEEERKRISEK